MCGGRTKLAGAAGDQGLRAASNASRERGPCLGEEGIRRGRGPGAALERTRCPRLTCAHGAQRPARMPSPDSAPPRPPAPPPAPPPRPPGPRGRHPGLPSLPRRAEPPGVGTPRAGWRRWSRPAHPRLGASVRALDAAPPPGVSPGPGLGRGAGVSLWGALWVREGRGRELPPLPPVVPERQPPPYRGTAPAGPRPAPAHWLRRAGSRLRGPGAAADPPLRFVFPSLAGPRLCLPPRAVPRTPRSSASLWETDRLVCPGPGRPRVGKGWKPKAPHRSARGVDKFRLRSQDTGRFRRTVPGHRCLSFSRWPSSRPVVEPLQPKGSRWGDPEGGLRFPPGSLPAESSSLQGPSPMSTKRAKEDGSSTRSRQAGPQGCEA
uniref:WAS/WASL-interacting protein family member 1-like n=1 Tax=Castor canadensis TaxID=51338 RepID=A0A8B7WK27_CASCN|nr:WAS/WASL-interacting protein family member 1-like [Castor canadensis]